MNLMKRKRRRTKAGPSPLTRVIPSRLTGAIWAITMAVAMTLGTGEAMGQENTENPGIVPGVIQKMQIDESSEEKRRSLYRERNPYFMRQLEKEYLFKEAEEIEDGYRTILPSLHSLSEGNVDSYSSVGLKFSNMTPRWKFMGIRQWKNKKKNLWIASITATDAEAVRLSITYHNDPNGSEFIIYGVHDNWHMEAMYSSFPTYTGGKSQQTSGYVAGSTITILFAADPGVHPPIDNYYFSIETVIYSVPNEPSMNLPGRE